MPQTTTALNTVDGVAEVSTDGVTWSNISGTFNKLEVSPQTTDSGSIATLEGQYKIVRAGKYNPVDLTLTLVYTETSGEAYALLHAQKNIAGRGWYFRYTPAGSNGEWRYYTADSSGNKAPARITEFPYPGLDAGDASPAVVVVKMQATQLARENATPSPSASVSPSASSSA